MTVMRRKIIKIGIFVVVVAFTGAVIFSAGVKYGRSQAQIIVIEGVKSIEAPKEAGVDFNLFWEAWNKLKELHLKGGEISNQDLMYGAINGLVASLKDPYSSFFNPPDAKRFIEDVSGNFSGIGAEIGTRKEQLVVIAPLKDSPAERAGLKSGDQILKIDDTATSGLSLDEAVKLIRGDVGTAVTLLILHKGTEEAQEIKIVREPIVAPTLDVEKKDGGIIVVKLYSFNENANDAFYGAMSKGFREGMRGMVLDLRNNPGGYLNVAVDLAGWFLERGTLVVSEESRTGEVQKFIARGNEALKNVPVTILVNEGSASASEILAGALRDQRGAKLIGAKTFGKGTVQELQDLRDGSVLKVTIAHWLMPSGKLIEGNGLAPDFDVELTGEDIDQNKDPQLDKAIEVLKDEMQ